MEASHKRHRPHIKVGKDEEKKKMFDSSSLARARGLGYEIGNAIITPYGALLL